MLSIKNDLKVPVKFIGVGEGIDDLQPFSPKAFAEGLFEALPEDYEEDEIDLSKIKEEIPSTPSESEELAQAVGEVLKAMAEIQEDEASEEVAPETDEAVEETVVEEETVTETPVEATVVTEETEDATDEEPVVASEPPRTEEKIEEATEAPKKKKGFFGRLFGG